MLKRYTFWFSAAVLFQLLLGIMNFFSLFGSGAIDVETQRQINDLLASHQVSSGSLFHPTIQDLFTAFGSSLSFLCFFAGLTNGYLLLKFTEPKVMRGIIAINLLIFGPLFAVLAYFTFLPPILFSGLIFINLIAAFIVIPNIESAV